MLARARFTRSGAVARRSVRPVAARVSVPRRLYSSKRPLPFEPKDGGLKDLVLDERRDEDLLRLFKYDVRAAHDEWWWACSLFILPHYSAKLNSKMISAFSEDAPLLREKSPGRIISTK